MRLIEFHQKENKYLTHLFPAELKTQSQILRQKATILMCYHEKCASEICI